MDIDKNTSIFLNQNQFNLSFIYSFFQTFILIFISELGGDNFFLLIDYKKKINKFIILFSSLIGELIFLLINILIGYSLNLLIYKNIIDYLAIIFLIIYSFFLLFNIYLEGKNFSEITQTENEKIIILPLKISNIPNNNLINTNKTNKSLSTIPEINEDSNIDENTLNTPLLENFPNKLYFQNENNQIENSLKNYESQIPTNEQLNEDSTFKLLCIILYKIIFSELGEKVQVCNIILSATFNIKGVFLGSLLALISTCFIGVFVNNKFILEFINQRLFKFISAIIILIYGIEISLFI